MPEVVIKPDTPEIAETAVETQIETATEIAEQASEQAAETINMATQIADLMERARESGEYMRGEIFDALRRIEEIQSEIRSRLDQIESSLTVLAIAEAAEVEEEQSEENDTETAQAMERISESAASVTEAAVTVAETAEEPAPRKSKRRFV